MLFPDEGRYRPAVPPEDRTKIEKPVLIARPDLLRNGDDRRVGEAAGCSLEPGQRRGFDEELIRPPFEVNRAGLPEIAGLAAPGQPLNERRSPSRDPGPRVASLRNGVVSLRFRRRTRRLIVEVPAAGGRDEHRPPAS